MHYLLAPFGGLVRPPGRFWIAVVASFIAILYQLHGPTSYCEKTKNTVISHHEPLRVPPCNITSREAKSAIERAKTVRCKNELADFACLLQAEKVYPRDLPNTCASVQIVSPDTLRSTPIRILYVLTVHGRDVRQILRLLKLIYRNEDFFLIHVDSRSSYLFGKLQFLEQRFANVHLLRERESPIWGGASLLTTLINAMKYGLRHDGWNWDYMINLSESDLPIKPKADLAAYLMQNFGKNFAKSHGTDTEKFIKRQGLDKTFYQCEDHMWRLGARQLPRGITIDGGSDWIALHRPFCEFIVGEQSDEFIRGLMTVYNYTLLPAESFFHTVLQNSKFCHTFVNNNLRLTNWKRKKGCNCQYKHIVDWCGCSPNAFRTEDLDKIRSFSLRPIFFARKFDPFADLGVINVLLQNNSAASDTEHSSWLKHWMNLYSRLGEPLPSETKALYQSLAGVAVRNLTKSSSRYTPKFLDVHVAVSVDGARSILVLQKLSVDKVNVMLESLFSFTSHFEADGSLIDTVADRLLDLQVSTDFDQKEELFRNYLSIIGPYSQPGLSISVEEGESAVTSVVWIDPADVIAGSFEVNISAEGGTFLHKPSFKRPLRPGAWRVYVMQNWRAVAWTKFLVIPLNDVSTPKPNNGPEGNEYISYNFTSVAKLFKLDPSVSLSIAEINSNKFGMELDNWMVDLVGEFYRLEASCVSGNESSGKVHLPSCEVSAWSSFFPDLKTIF